MTDKELRRLGRADLLDLLVTETRKNEELTARVRALEDQLADREIRLDRAGSIAEASLALSGVFEAADKAAAQYLENIEQLSRRMDDVCSRQESRVRKACEERERETAARCTRMEAETRRNCSDMMEKALAAVRSYMAADGKQLAEGQPGAQQFFRTTDGEQ